MKYKVQIYCRVPDAVAMTPRLGWELSHKGLVDGGIKEMVFDSEEALYHYARGYDYCSLAGASGNHVLEATMTKHNDSLRHKTLFKDARCSRELFEKCRNNHELIDKYGLEHYCLGYLIKDENGRTIDLRNYQEELCKFDYAGYDNLLRKKYSIESQERRASWQLYWDDLWEKRERLTEGSSYWGSLKRFRTFPERRRNCDTEHKPFIRGKRRHLPDPWGSEKPIIKEKTWKSRTKVKRQWLVNMPIHIDTAKHEI